MAETIMLVLGVEGARKRRIPFPKSAGWEVLKSMIAREFDADAIAEISYSIDGKVFAIAGNDSLRGYLQENPRPPLMITLSSAVPTASSAASTSATPVGVPRPAIPTSTPPHSEPPLPSATPCGLAPPPPPPPPPLRPTLDNDTCPNGSPPNNDSSLEPLPPLPMCALRLEAVGLPQRTVEITPDQVDSMRLADFMGLLAAQFEGHAVAGAPAVGAVPEGISGLVDSTEALHALLKASLTQPVTLQVPLRSLPTDKADRKKHKHKKNRGQKGCQATEEVKPAVGAQAEGDGRRDTADAAPRDVVPPPTDPPPAQRIRELAAALTAFPTESFLANTALARAVLGAITELVLKDERLAPIFGRAGVVAPLVRMLAATDLATTCPAVAEQLLLAIANLALDNTALFGRAGVAAPLVRMLTHPDLPTMNATALVRAGVVAPLVRLLDTRPDLLTANYAVAEQLLPAVANLAVDPETSAALGRAGVVPPVLRILAAHPDLPIASPSMTLQLIAVISNLSAYCPANRAALAAARPGLERYLGLPGVDQKLVRGVLFLLGTGGVAHVRQSSSPYALWS
ncbi:hypothetical protein PAPYR_10857 [Paratrimastix pyriformis]|uniref:Uncharacterized protein n=1 Tax=Paratrimastix pyriformis TaxID=342808 RepID=A0ABQ8U514_9EUKA|nr:hypothetical protein PAPYR_10857 [Paratrimastix pyriformis]